MKTNQRNLLRSLIYPLLVVLFFLCPVQKSSGHQDKRAVVLVLHSFTYTALWNREFNQAFEEHTKDLDVYIQYEHLNVNNFPEADLLKQKCNILKNKYNPKFRVSQSVPSPDLVITVGQPAMEFVMANPDAFGNVPTVFSGVVQTNVLNRDWEELPNVTSVFNAVDFRANTELLSKLHPECSEIFIVIGDSNIGSREYANAVEQLEDVDIPQTITYLLGSEYSTAELLDCLKQKRASSVVLFMNWTLDRNLEHISNPEIVNLISSEVEIPIYGQYSALLGEGIIGGHLVSAKRQAIETVTVLNQILSGAEPSSIFQADHGSRDLLFDYDQLKRWGIHLDELPQKSVVINQPHTIWTDYKGYVIVAVLVFVFQCLTLVSFAVAFYFKRKMAILRHENEKALEKELQKSQKLALDLQKALNTKRSFLEMMSHELRTPLHPIIGLADYLLDKEHDSDSIDVLKMIRESGKNLLEHIDTLLQYVSHKDETSLIMIEAIHVPDLLEEVILKQNTKASEKGLKLLLENSIQKQELVYTDRFYLSQIVNKLVSNAIKFTDSGKVVVSAFMTKKYEEFVPYVEITVKDTGIGISKEYEDQIFDAFSQVDSSTSRKFGGIGLGLSLTKKFVESLNGEICIDSEVNIGSCFTVRIPQNQKFDHMKDSVQSTNQVCA